MSIYENVEKMEQAKLGMSRIMRKYVQEGLQEIMEEYGVLPSDIDIEMVEYQRMCDEFKKHALGSCHCRLEVLS